VHAPRILMEECGYSEQEVLDMYDAGTVLPIYWDSNNTAKDSHVWPREVQSKRRKLMDPKSFSWFTGPVPHQTAF